MDTGSWSTLRFAESYKYNSSVDHGPWGMTTGRDGHYPDKTH